MSHLSKKQSPAFILENGADFEMNNNRNPLKAMGLMSAILAQLAGSTLIGVFGGMWLDQHWGTEPVFLIIGLFIGLTTGIYTMLVSIRHFFSGD